MECGLSTLPRHWRRCRILGTICFRSVGGAANSVGGVYCRFGHRNRYCPTETRRGGRRFLRNRFPHSAHRAHRHAAVDGGGGYGLCGGVCQRGVWRHGIQHFQCGAHHARVPIFCLSDQNVGRPSVCAYPRCFLVGRRQRRRWLFGRYTARTTRHIGYGRRSHARCVGQPHRIFRRFHRLDSRLGGRNFYIGHSAGRSGADCNGRGKLENHAVRVCRRCTHGFGVQLMGPRHGHCPSALVRTSGVGRLCVRRRVYGHRPCNCSTHRSR